MESEITEVPTPRSLEQSAVKPTGQHYTWWQAWWKALTRPTPATFSQLLADPAMSLRRAVWWVAAAAVVAAALTPLRQGHPGDYGSLGDWVVVILLRSLATLLIGLVLPFIVTGVVHIAARALGGSGTYASLFYAFAAIYAPLFCAMALTAPFALVATIISEVPGQTVGLLEFVNRLIYGFIQLLSILLLVFGLIGLASATRAVHKLTWGKTLISAWVPVIGLLVLFFGCALSAFLVTMGVFG